MNCKKAVRSIMEAKGVRTSAMAAMLGSNMQKVVDRLSEGKGSNMSVETLDEFMKLLGYRIVLVPDDVEIQDGWYEVDSIPSVTPPRSLESGPAETNAVPKIAKKTKKGR